MKPEVDRFLERAMQQLRLQIGPSLANAYEQSSVMVMALMLTAVREEWERAAARRVEENAALRTLFGEALPAVADAGLRGRLESAAAGEDASLLVSQLEAGNAALRALLVELHEYVEQCDGEAARGVESAIWRELLASTERRKLGIGAF